MFYENKVFLGLRPATLLKKRLWHWCFPVNSAKFRRTLFFYRTPLNGRLVTEFPQTRGPSLTAIHPINTAGLFNYNAYKKLQVVRRYHHFPVILITLSSIFSHTFQAQTLFPIHLSWSQTSCTSSGPSQKEKKSSVSLFNDQVIIFPARNPPQKCFRANLPVIIIPYFKNYYIPQEL